MEVFKKGQKVRRRQGGNATNFNTGELDIMGASNDKYDKETVFEIEGTIKLITFSFSKNVYGAYLLSKDGVNVGYVYNTYLIKAKTPKVSKKTRLLLKYIKTLKEYNDYVEKFENTGLGYQKTLRGKSDVLNMVIKDLETLNK